MSREINANMDALQNFAKEMAGATLPEKDRVVVQMLAEVGLALLRQFLLDINRIADAAEILAEK